MGGDEERLRLGVVGAGTELCFPGPGWHGGEFIGDLRFILCFTYFLRGLLCTLILLLRLLLGTFDATLDSLFNLIRPVHTEEFNSLRLTTLNLESKKYS